MKRATELLMCDVCGDEVEHTKLEQVTSTFKGITIPWLIVEREKADDLHVCSRCHAGAFEFITDFMKLDGARSKNIAEGVTILKLIMPLLLDKMQEALLKQ